jgi:hypothetical protein
MALPAILSIPSVTSVRCSSRTSRCSRPKAHCPPKTRTRDLLDLLCGLRDLCAMLSPELRVFLARKLRCPLVLFLVARIHHLGSGQNDRHISADVDHGDHRDRQNLTRDPDESREKLDPLGRFLFIQVTQEAKLFAQV